MSNNLPTSFNIAFDNKLPRDKRVDILDAIRNQSWWQETDYGRQRERLHFVRVIVNDANLLEQAKAYVNGFEGATAENIGHYDTQNDAINRETGARIGPPPKVAKGFASLEFHYDRLDKLLTSHLNELKEKDPDVYETKLDIFLETVAGIDEATAERLKKLGVDARATATKATFVGEVSLKALSLLSQYEEVVKQLFGSVQYQAL